MSSSGVYTRLADSKNETKMVIRNPRINRIESYLDQLNLQPTTYEKILASIVAMVNALGNAELPSSFLWFLTTDVAEVGLGVTDLTVSRQPLASQLAFYGTMAITLIVSGVGTRLFYVNDVNGVQDRINSVLEEEFQQETFTRELLFETLRFRSLVSDEKNFKELSPKLPSYFLSETFLTEIESTYSKFLSNDSKEVDQVLKKKLIDSDFAFDEEFRQEVIEKILSEIGILSASKHFSLLPVVRGDHSKAMTEGVMGGLLMSGTLFPAWWAVFSLLVAMEIYNQTSLTGFCGTAVSLTVIGLGIGFFMGKQENKNSRREALAQELHSRNKDLLKAIKTIRQLNLKMCQKQNASQVHHSETDAKTLPQPVASMPVDAKAFQPNVTHLLTLGLHAAPSARLLTQNSVPLKRSNSFS